MPSVLIGLGGIGCGTVKRVKKSLITHPVYKELVDSEQVLFCGLDVDLKFDADIGVEIVYPAEFKTLRPTQVIREYEQDPEFKSWWIPGHKITAPIAGQSGAGQIRINGRLAYFDNFRKIEETLDNFIEKAKQVSINLRQRGGSKEGSKVRIFMVSSLAGGTGAGILIDAVHLVRKLCEEEDRVYGILFDGSIIEKLIKGNAGLYTFASLTEIERWMVNPREFIMKYKGDTVQNNKEKFFDIAFLIQANNMDSRCFYGSPIDIKKNFQTMAALFLESIVTISDFDRFLEANDWNQFDITRKTPGGRSCSYASFAVSEITFPAEKVTNYCYAKLITERLKDGFMLQKPDFLTIQKDLEICEHDGIQLTNYLHKLDSAQAFLRKTDNTKNTFSQCNDKERFTSIYSENDLINFGEWNRLITRYNTEILNALKEKEKEVKETIEKVIVNLIGTLKFTDIKNILYEFKGAINDNKRHVSENKKLWDKKDNLRIKLKTDYDAVIKCKRGILGFGDEFLRRRNNFINTFVNWTRSELEAAEHRVMLNFYNSLDSHIDNIIWVIEYIAESFNRNVSICAQQLGNYVSKDWIINPERQEISEYLFNMEISTTVKDVDEKIYKDLLDLVNEDLKGLLEEGKGDGFKGLKDIFKEILSRYSANPDKMGSRLRSEDEKERVYKGIESALEITIKNEIRNRIKKIGVTDALSWFLDKIYAEINRCRGDRTEEEGLQLRLENIFGEHNVQALLKNTDDYTSWCETAVRSLLDRVRSLTKPFIQVNETEVGRIWEGLKDVSERLKSFSLFVPEKFNEKYRSAIDVLKPNETQFDDRIILFSQNNFFPLHTLNLVKELKGNYQRNVTEVEKKIKERSKELPERPIHVDVRYYLDWKDDISISRADIKPREKDADLLFLLGLGMDIIKRDGQIFRIYGARGEFIEGVRGVEVLYQKLKNQEIKRLAQFIYDKFIEYYAKPNKIDLIREIFVNAHTKLKEIGMSKPKEGRLPEPKYEIWTRLLKLSELGTDGRPTIESIVPDTETKIEELHEKLKEMRRLA